MEWRKLKNLIILILLVVNGFLLVLVASRSRESAQYEHSALEHTVQVLERGGVFLRAGSFPAGTGGKLSSQLAACPQGHLPQAAAVEIYPAHLVVPLCIAAQQGPGQTGLLLQIPLYG